MTIYARPAETHPRAERTPVDGPCPVCGAAALASYQVNSEGGWFQVVKCRNCLHSTHREPWDLLGAIEMLSDNL